MDIVKKVEEFMRDNNLVQYYDLEASHKFEVEDSFNTGVNEGRAFGIAEGTQIEKHNIAKNLLNLNIDISMIMKSTDLFKNEILEL